MGLEHNVVDTITYRELLNRTKVLKTQLIDLHYWKTSARFDLHMDLLEKLTIAFESGNFKSFLIKENQKGECIFMLKELREFADIFETFLPQLKNLDKQSLHEFAVNIKHILRGPQYTTEETTKNSKARDYLFELAIAAQFIKWGADIQLRINPDVMVSTKNNTYMVECKRVVTSGNQNERLARLTLEASNQLLGCKRLTGVKMGIVALDLSSMFEKGDRVLPALDENEIYKIIQTDMQILQKYLLQNKKIIQYASRGLLTGCLMNTSVVTIIGDKSLSWASQKSFLPLQEKIILELEN